MKEDQAPKNPREELRLKAPAPMASPLFIGSLPMKDHKVALEEVLKMAPDTPHWVQLPSLPREGFLVQFCEGLPGLKMEPKVVVDTAAQGFEEELLCFYQEYLDVIEGKAPLEGSRFDLSREAVPGLYILLDRLSSRRCFVKGQISGPVSVLLGLYDQRGRCAYYDERLRDATVKLLELKARRQAELLSSTAEHCLISVDEPALGGLGSSAYLSVQDEEALSLVGTVVRSIQEAGGWAAVHVCANADWGKLLDLDMDVLSFDAFSYFERVALFRDQVLSFLRSGGALAWGIVPTREDALERTSCSELMDMLISQARQLTQGAMSLRGLLKRVFVTPSCGLGSLSGEHALKAMDVTAQLARSLRASFLEP